VPIEEGERAVVASGVVVGPVVEGRIVQGVGQLGRGVDPVILRGKPAEGLDVGPVCWDLGEENLVVRGRWWVSLMLGGDEEGDGEVGLAGGALAWDHTGSNRGSHCDLLLVCVVSVDVVEEAVESLTDGGLVVHAHYLRAHPVG